MHSSLALTISRHRHRKSIRRTRRRARFIGGSTRSRAHDRRSPVSAFKAVRSARPGALPRSSCRAAAQFTVGGGSGSRPALISSLWTDRRRPGSQDASQQFNGHSRIRPARRAIGGNARRTTRMPRPPPGVKPRSRYSSRSSNAGSPAEPGSWVRFGIAINAGNYAEHAAPCKSAWRQFAQISSHRTSFARQVARSITWPDHDACSPVDRPTPKR